MEKCKVIDWEAYRDQFPVTKKYAYFINASMTPLSKQVFNAGLDYWTRLHQEGDFSWTPAMEVVESARLKLASALGGHPRCYAFGANSNHNMGLLAHAFKEKYGLGDIVISPDEFPSSYIPWKYLGFNIIFHRGRLEEAVSEKTIAVISSTVHSLTGERVDVEDLGHKLEQKGIPFIVNATQSFGIFPLKLEDIKASAMVCSLHKFLGAGYAASIFYVEEGFMPNLRWPMAGLMSFDDPDFRGDISRPKEDLSFVEVGAPPFMSLIALEASLTGIEELGVENIERRVLELGKYFVSEGQRHGLKFRQSERPTHIYCLKLDDPKAWVEKLKEQNILVNERAGYLRVSFHYFNNEVDIDRLIKALVS
jgi:selenocysteine lyase/cysteine desulfurase